MYTLQIAIQCVSRAAGSRRRNCAGPDSATSMKPSPSTARSTSSGVAVRAPAPAALAAASSPSPINMLRRRPMRSTTSPSSSPIDMPASCTIDSRKPACSSDRFSVACSAAMAGGSLPTWAAAPMPATTTIQAARSAPGPSGTLMGLGEVRTNCLRLLLKS